MELLLAVCRPAPDPVAVAALVAGPLDAGLLLRLARRHRVGALAHRGFRLAGVAPPAGAKAGLAAAAQRTGRRALGLAAETVRLVGALAKAEVPVVAIKGASLAILAHGTLATKEARDIDLLIAPARLATAAAVMVAAGYRRIGEGHAVPLAAWHRFAKDSTWRHPARRATVELHTALTDFPRHLLPGLDTGSPTRAVAIAAGRTVPTFAPEPLFAYLCVHGALSGWRRLKWLADLAGLMHDLDADAIARLHAAAGAMGAGRAATQAVALSARLLATPLPAEVAAALARDPASRWLVARAERLLTDPDGYDDPDERVFGTLPIHLMTLALAPVRGFRRAVLRRYLRADPGGRLPYPLARLAERLRQGTGRRPAAALRPTMDDCGPGPT